MAGAIADGVVAHPMATAPLHRGGDAPGDRRGRGGARAASPSDVAVADWVLLAISDDREQAREDAKRQIAFHATVRTYDRILDLHGFTEVAARIRELWKSFDLAGMTALVTDEMLDEMAVAGTPDECRAALEQRARERGPPAARRARRRDGPGSHPRLPRRDRRDVRPLIDSISDSNCTPRSRRCKRSRDAARAPDPALHQRRACRPRGRPQGAGRSSGSTTTRPTARRSARSAARTWCR